MHDFEMHDFELHEFFTPPKTCFSRPYCIQIFSYTKKIHWCLVNLIIQQLLLTKLPSFLCTSITLVRGKYEGMKKNKKRLFRVKKLTKIGAFNVRNCAKG